MGDTAARSTQMADEQYSAQDDPSSSSSDMQPVHDVLNTWTLSEYLGTKPPSHVVVIPSSMTVANVLKVLATSSILSAPVFSEDDNEFLGFVDIGDLLTYLLGMINVQTLTEANQAYTLRSAGLRLESEPVRNVVPSNDGALIYTAYLQTSLMEVVQRGFLQQAPTGRRVCHRVAVFDLEDEATASEEDMCGGSQDRPVTGIRITHVVSQSDVLRFLAKRGSALGQVMGRTLEQLGLAFKPVVCVPAGMSTIHAFATMQAEQVSSVGIISHDHGGALVANLSVSDLRGLLPQHLQALSLTVLQFVTARASIAGWPAARHAPSNEWGLKGAEALKEPTPVTCRPGATLMQVVDLMISQRVHRVYVVDERKHARGIVTVTDVLTLFAGGQQEQQAMDL